MIIQHNIMAMNAYRNYKNNTSALSSNLEKLSSGYKINRAGDDAAGLAISEKMRAQITGLEAAQKNVKDGISLVKTAEGAMQEVQDMLNRMDYLATQSANGTYDNEVDRANLQKEVDALKTEINRIADSANFNGIKLLNGDLAKADAVPATTESVSVTGMDRILTSVIGEGEQPYQVNNVKTVLDSYAATATAGAFSIDFTTLSFNVSYVGTATGTIASATASATDLGSFTVTIGSKEWSFTGSDFASGVATNVKINSSGTISGTIAGSAVAQAILNKMAGTSSATKAFITLNNVQWKASISSGVLTFTQINKPNTASEAVTDFSVKISHTSGSGSTFGITMNDDLQDGTKTVTAGIPVGSARGAATVFEIKADDIVDGAQITLGSSTYTLAVGKDSKYAASATASDVIDLTSMEVGNADLLRTALTKFGSKCSSVTFKCGTATASFSVSVTENGIAVMRATAPTAASEVIFNSLEKLAANFSLSYTVNHEAQAAKTGLTLQIGDTSDDFNQMKVVIGDMHTSAMGAGEYMGETIEKTIADVDISTQEGAAEAVNIIKNAINYVSGIRGDLGAVQNRLEHTANNLSVMAENITDAESTIRDTDVAEEMMSYVKNNILVQSAQAMLAQANQVPQGVLQLLG